MFFLDSFLHSFSRQDSRTKNVGKNSLIMFLCKGISILIGFFMLPMTVGYVDSDTYGIWVTISSMVAWMSIFDIGMGNGLKNKFVEYRAKGDNKTVQKYVSTTYAMLILIFIPFLLVFLVANAFVNWNIVMNVSTEENLNLIFAILVSYFALNFILSTINIVLSADQRPGESSIIMVVQHIIMFLAIIILTKTTSGSLLKLCIALCALPLIVILLFNLTFFRGKYCSIRPKWSCVSFSIVGDLLNLSFKFFYLQIVYLLLFQLTNFVIIRYFTPNDVTLYNVANKYFTIPNGIFAAITSPIWAAVAEALTLKDYAWIKKSLKRYTYLLLLFCTGELLMLIIATPVYRIWMGNTISEIPFMISFLCMLSACITMSTNIYVSALCGSGYLKLQMYFCVLSPIIFILLCYLFIMVLKWGVWCILLSNVIANIYGVLIAPLQCYMVYYKRANGLWTA